MNQTKLSAQEINLLTAGQGGVREKDLVAWLNTIKAEAESDDYMLKGVSYDAEANTVRFTGVITDDLMAMWMDGLGVASPGMLDKAVAQAKPGYSLHINSPGGNVFAAVQMISMLRANTPSQTVITGIAASAAALIALVGEQRVAGNEMSMLMFHAPMTAAYGNATELSEVVDTLRKIEETMGDFITASLPTAAAKDVVAAINGGKDKFYSATEAVGMGILTSVAGTETKPDADPEPETDPKPDEDDPDARLEGLDKLAAEAAGVKLGQRSLIDIDASEKEGDNSEQLMIEQQAHFAHTESQLAIARASR